MKAHVIFSLVFLLILPPFSAYPEGEESPPDPEETGIPVSITQLIPGLPQLSEGRYARGALLLGIFTGCFAGALTSNHRGYQLYDEYLLSLDVDETSRLRRDSEQAFRNRNLFLIGSAAVWLLHLVDLALWNPRSRIKGEISQNGLSVGVTVCF